MKIIISTLLVLAFATPGFATGGLWDGELAWESYPPYMTEEATYCSDFHIHRRNGIQSLSQVQANFTYLGATQDELDFWASTIHPAYTTHIDNLRVACKVRHAARIAE
jgi:hypothetical protein